MILLAQLVVYLLAVAGVIACTFGAILFAGGALNRARPLDMRLRRGALAGLCVCGIVAAATLGFVGVPTIMYLATR